MTKVRLWLMSISRLLFVVLLQLLVFVFAMFQGGMVSWTIFYTLLPFVCYSIGLYFYPLSNFSGERIIRKASLQDGEKLRVKIIVKRKFRFPLLYTVVEEKWSNKDLPKKIGRLKKIFVFGFSKNKVWDYEVKEIHRGEHVLKGLVIEVSDFFGWIKKTHFIPMEDTILVYPKMIDIHYAPMGVQHEQGVLQTPYHIVKDTTMASGVRNYQPGDRVSWIHWKSFARTEVLMTKEFEDKRSQDLLLIFDRRYSILFEERVEFAASILLSASKQRVNMDFYATGAVISSVQSEIELQKILVYLARILPAEDNLVGNLSADLRLVVGRKGHILVITSNPDAEFLKSIMLNAINARAISCFVIVEKDVALNDKLTKDIQFVKSKGITVYTLAKEQFSKVFKGGYRHE